MNMKQLVEDALSRRQDLTAELAGQTDAYRLINSEGDRLGGLTVDRLAEILLVERHKQSAEAEALVEILDETFPETPVFLKERWIARAREDACHQVAGPAHPGRVTVSECGARFRVDVTHGEHIGLFLDSRPARQLVRNLASGRRVLNLFAYTGGFGLVAALGGARSTTNVDNKPSALEGGEINYTLNGAPFDTRTFVKSDVFEYLKRGGRGRGRYDLIVVDPPPRIQLRRGKRWSVDTGYARLAARCLALLDRGGALLAGANALFVTDEEFRAQLFEAAALQQVRMKTTRTIAPDRDFPPSADRPTARFCLMEIGPEGN